MATLQVAGFKPSPNHQIMNSLRGMLTNDYQRRVPVATQANVQDAVAEIMNYQPNRNQFMNALINRIGLVIARDQSWSNPLAKFKRGLLQYGDTIEEVMTGLLDAYTYDHDRESLEQDIFGTERVHSQSSFHKINRENYYKITVNEMQLQRAFLEPMGLSNLIAQLMQAPVTSDQWDEFLLMTRLFKENYDNNGFFKVNSRDVFSDTSTAEDAKSFLRQVRTYAGKLQFINPLYNAAKMPTAARPDELELFITPEAQAAIDVEALAAAFNIDRANINQRMTVIPNEQFGIPGAQAVLTTKDFFVVADTLFTTTEQYNPVSLSSNYFLHHHQIISLSRFVPAIMFTTEPGTEVIEVSTPVASVAPITMVDGNDEPITEAERNSLVQLVSEAVTTPTGGVNRAVRWHLTGAQSEKTRLTQTGVLFVAENETGVTVPGEGDDPDTHELTVTATAVDDPTKSATATVKLTGDVITLWPVPENE